MNRISRTLRSVNTSDLQHIYRLKGLHSGVTIIVNENVPELPVTAFKHGMLDTRVAVVCGLGLVNRPTLQTKEDKSRYLKCLDRIQNLDLNIDDVSNSSIDKNLPFPYVGKTRVSG